jgi:hypothetical protein
LKTRTSNRAQVDTRDVDAFTAYLAMIDLIDNEMPNVATLGELRTLLTIWRKTHGWGKVADEIGTTELERRTGLDRSTVRRSVKGIAKAGYVVVEDSRVELASGAALHRRKKFTWPINERVKEVLAKAKASQDPNCEVVGTSRTYPRVHDAPTRWVKDAPTQSSISSESCAPQSCNSDEQPTKRKERDSQAGCGPRTIDETPKAQTRPRRPSSEGSRHYPAADLGWMADALNRYGGKPSMSEFMRQSAPPNIIRMCLKAADGTPLRDIGEILRHRCFNGCLPGRSKGPRGWGWFPTVIANAIRGWRKWEAVARDPSPNGYCDDFNVATDSQMLRAGPDLCTVDIDSLRETA